MKKETKPNSSIRKKLLQQKSMKQKIYNNREGKQNQNIDYFNKIDNLAADCPR